MPCRLFEEILQQHVDFRTRMRGHGEKISLLSWRSALRMSVKATGRRSITVFSTLAQKAFDGQSSNVIAGGMLLRGKRTTAETTEADNASGVKTVNFRCGAYHNVDSHAVDKFSAGLPGDALSGQPVSRRRATNPRTSGVRSLRSWRRGHRVSRHGRQE